MPRETYRDTGLFSGLHRSNTLSTVLYDNRVDFTISDCVGRLVSNDTDGSTGVVTSNTEHTISVTLAGGTNNLWAAGDEYTVYVGAVANAVLSHTWMCRLSGFAYPRDSLDGDTHSDFDDQGERFPGKYTPVGVVEDLPAGAVSHPLLQSEDGGSIKTEDGQYIRTEQ